jgi:hypothetical protein
MYKNLKEYLEFKMKALQDLDKSESLKQFLSLTVAVTNFLTTNRQFKGIRLSSLSKVTSLQWFSIID